ncbi:hypothetical protein BY996DRAFT_6620479 [Phakopsora pachyrhizi]|nr:hypothetical protein BY996DRAFT_6620479 [Phakopsora pachyrhizi]
MRFSPTLECFNLASKSFAKGKHLMWRDHDTNRKSLHIFSRNSLFLSPLDERNPQSEESVECLQKYDVFSQFMEKALANSQTDELFSQIFLQLISDCERCNIIPRMMLDNFTGTSLFHHYKINNGLLDKAEIESSITTIKKFTKRMLFEEAIVPDSAEKIAELGYENGTTHGWTNTVVTTKGIAKFRLL